MRPWMIYVERLENSCPPLKGSTFQRSDIDVVLLCATRSSRPRGNAKASYQCLSPKCLDIQSEVLPNQSGVSEGGVQSISTAGLIDRGVVDIRA